MSARSNSDTRVVYPGSGSAFMFAIVSIPLGAVAVFCLRIAWVGMTLRDGWPVSIGFAAFAALMLWMILHFGWYIFGPSKILTPTHIIVPGAFKTRRYPISPDTPVIQWDRRYTRQAGYQQGERISRSRIVETSALYMPGKTDRAAPLWSARFGSGGLEPKIADLKRVAGIEVQHLTPGGMVPDPAPKPSDWPKRGESP